MRLGILLAMFLVSFITWTSLHLVNDLAYLGIILVSPKEASFVTTVRIINAFTNHTRILILFYFTFAAYEVKLKLSARSPQDFEAQLLYHRRVSLSVLISASIVQIIIFICHVLDYSYVIAENSPGYKPLVWLELSAKIVATSLDIAIALIFTAILRFYLRNKEKHTTSPAIHVDIPNLKQSRNCLGGSKGRCKVVTIFGLVVVNFMEGVFSLTQPIMALTLNSNTPGSTGDLIQNYYITIVRVQFMLASGLGFLYLAYHMGMQRQILKRDIRRRDGTVSLLVEDKNRRPVSLNQEDTHGSQASAMYRKKSNQLSSTIDDITSLVEIKKLDDGSRIERVADDEGLFFRYYLKSIFK